METNVKIQELREKNSYTQRNIADYLAVNREFVSNLITLIKKHSLLIL